METREGKACNVCVCGEGGLGGYSGTYEIVAQLVQRSAEKGKKCRAKYTLCSDGLCVHEAERGGGGGLQAT